MDSTEAIFAQFYVKPGGLFNAVGVTHELQPGLDNGTDPSKSVRLDGWSLLNVGSFRGGAGYLVRKVIDRDSHFEIVLELPSMITVTVRVDNDANLHIGATCPRPTPAYPGDNAVAVPAEPVPMPREQKFVTSSTGGRKEIKLARFDLIPVEPLVMLAEHYGRGAEKYEPRNWERGYDWSLSYASLNRHLLAFWGGEDVDEETGSLHLTAATWHAIALTEFCLKHPEFDDRPNTHTLTEGLQK